MMKNHLDETRKRRNGLNRKREREIRKMHQKT